MIYSVNLADGSQMSLKCDQVHQWLADNKEAVSSVERERRDQIQRYIRAMVGNLISRYRNAVVSDWEMNENE